MWLTLRLHVRLISNTFTSKHQTVREANCCTKFAAESIHVTDRQNYDSQDRASVAALHGTSEGI